MALTVGANYCDSWNEPRKAGIWLETNNRFWRLRCFSRCRGVAERTRERYRSSRREKMHKEQDGRLYRNSQRGKPWKSYCDLIVKGQSRTRQQRKSIFCNIIDLPSTTYPPFCQDACGYNTVVHLHILHKSLRLYDDLIQISSTTLRIILFLSLMA